MGIPPSRGCRRRVNLTAADPEEAAAAGPGWPPPEPVHVSEAPDCLSRSSGHKRLGWRKVGQPGAGRCLLRALAPPTSRAGWAPPPRAPPAALRAFALLPGLPLLQLQVLPLLFFWGGAPCLPDALPLPLSSCTTLHVHFCCPCLLIQPI